MMSPDSDYWEANQAAIEAITSEAVGFAVEVCAAAIVNRLGRRTSYQILPVSEPDGGVFWKWHQVRHSQWFPTPLKAATAFVRAWQYFRGHGRQTGKPLHGASSTESAARASRHE